jgi:hypothetical protein
LTRIFQTRYVHLPTAPIRIFVIVTSDSTYKSSVRGDDDRDEMWRDGVAEIN